MVDAPYEAPEEAKIQFEVGSQEASQALFRGEQHEVQGVAAGIA